MFSALWQTNSGLFRSNISWEYTLPLALIIAVAVGFVVLLVLQWRALKPRVTTGTRWGLCLLRGVVYLFILLMLLNPTLVIQKVLRLLPSLAVVLDTSASMALSDNDERPRLQQALDYLNTGDPSPLETLSERYQVNLYQLDETVRTLSQPQLDALTGDGSRTDITGALTTLLEEERGTQPVGMLMFSDGAHHGPDAGMAYLGQAKVPVVAVGVGNPATYRDIQIASVQAPGLTFLHYPVTVQVNLNVWGYQGERVPVVLKRAGRVVATETVQITSSETQYQVAFDILPEDIGDFTYTVSIAPRLGEVLTDNNTRSFPISVARDKIRVLLVCGSPTWNYRFLRRAFKQDPSVDLISFVILRTPTDVVNVPESQLSLIPFPTRRLFTQELHNFDLIIFENFSFQFYFPWYYLENVQTYVQEGGAFAMIGGSLAFAQGGYSGTPIEEILPVTLRRGRSDYRQAVHRMVLTPEGMRHPITRLAADPDENLRIWGELTELDALNIVARPKPEATVLGVSNGQFGDAVPAPLLAVQRVGKGRSLALMSDYIWKWNFQMAGQMDSNQYYLQFIRQLVRWLIRDPGLKPLRITSDATEFPLGSDVTGTIHLLQDNYRPDETATPIATLREPNGTTVPLQTVPTGNPGEFSYRFHPTTAGLHSLDVNAKLGPEMEESNRLLLNVSDPGAEKQDAAPNHTFLKDVATTTGGAFFAIHDPARPTLSSLIDFFGGTPSYKVLEETRRRLRETFPLLIIVLVGLGIEWWWRRRVGLF